jgi:hypothetical protein
VRQPTPKIDPRTAPDFSRQVVEILSKDSVGDAELAGFKPGAGVSGALINIFARFAELITERLNRVPEKNFLAFLDLLGASLLPPRSARVPLTFTLSEAATEGAVVAAGSEVAAVSAEDQQEPAVFETERELVITSARLTAAFTRDPETDCYADHTLLLPERNEGGSPEAVFQAVTPIEHVLYIANDRIFNHPGKRNSLTIEFKPAGQGTLTVAWDSWDEQKKDWVQRQSGEIKSGDPIDLTTLNASPPTTIDQIQKRWLRCRLIGAITSKTILTALSAVTLSATFERKDRTVENAFANSSPIDTNRGFLPFGENPLPGDAFYLKLDKDFIEPGCKVTLNVAINMVGQAPKPLNLKVEWQFWDGTNWTTVPGLGDNTAHLTTSNTVTFNCSEKPALTSINGVEGYWVRGRLSSGSYGPGAELKVERSGDSYTYKSIPAAAPSINSMKISYETTLKDQLPEVILACNDFTYDKRTSLTKEGPIVPFRPTRDGKPAFYLGLEAPARSSRMPNIKINLYVGATGEAAEKERPEIAWQYSTGEGETGWASLVVVDDTANFSRPGVVEFLPPTDFARRSEFGGALFWLRAVLEKGAYAVEPRISWLLLNTVMARHATRIENEVLGSSDGSKNQRFRTSHAPVLEGQHLEVRELEMPSRIDQDSIRRNAGEDAISIVADEAGRPVEIWVRWKQAADFYGSGAHDRHYVLDHLSGEVRFGDGISGRVPLVGSGNIRMARYRTGGGVRGNNPARAITELRTTVPYVENVTNYIAASGGAEAESYDSLLERMPRTIRHGDRAVTYEDFEDLAMLASPDVARARCVRFYAKEGIGKVSLIIVPRSSEPKPLASLETKRRVQEFIEPRKAPLSVLTVSDPEYIEVKVTVEIAPASLEVANKLKIAVLERLTRFLHPLSGGFEGEGWGFGRKPHDSDLYYLIEAIPGVDHVINLRMTTPESEMNERSLVASGKHEVSCRFQAEPERPRTTASRPARKRPAPPLK